MPTQFEVNAHNVPHTQTLQGSEVGTHISSCFLVLMCHSTLQRTTLTLPYFKSWFPSGEGIVDYRSYRKWS